MRSATHRVRKNWVLTNFIFYHSLCGALLCDPRVHSRQIAHYLRYTCTSLMEDPPSGGVMLGDATAFDYPAEFMRDNARRMEENYMPSPQYPGGDVDFGNSDVPLFDNDGEQMRELQTYEQSQYEQEDREFRPLKQRSREVFEEKPVLERAEDVEWLPMRAFFCYSLLLAVLASIAITALVVGGTAMYDARHVPPPCKGACTYCEPNGTLVMPNGGRSERAFAAITIGVGPLFSPYNPTNFTGGNQMCELARLHNQEVSTNDGHADDDDVHHRSKRLAGYGNDLTWRLNARQTPGSYTISNGDANRPAVLEADGSAFILGNMTVTCGGYIGCETVSPLGNFTILYTQNTSNSQYFQVYPALEYTRTQTLLAFNEINALNITIQGLNSSLLAANITYLDQQVQLLWIAVNNITAGEQGEEQLLLNLTYTLVQLTNATAQLSYYVYNILPAEACNCTYINNTLIFIQSEIDDIQTILSQTNLTGLNETLYELNQILTLIDAQVDYIENLINNSGLLTNLTYLIQEVAILDNQVGNLTLVVQGQNVSITELYLLLSQLNATQLVLVQDVSTLQGNVTSLAVAQNVTQLQLLALTQVVANLSVNVSILEATTDGILVNLTALWVSQQAQDVLIAALNVTTLQVLDEIQLLNQTQQVLATNVSTLFAITDLHTIQIANLQGNQTTLITTVSGVQTNVSALQNQTAAQQVQIDAALQCCNSTNSTLYAFINSSAVNNASVWSQLAQVQLDITQVNQTAVQALTGVQQVNGTVTVLVSTTQSLQGNVTQLLSNVTELEACCANNSQQVSLIIAVNQAQNQSLLDLQTNVTTLDACCSANAAAIAQLITNSSGQQVLLNQLLAQVTSINGTVMTLVGNNLTIFSILDNHTAQITVLQGQTATLIVQVNQLNSTVINITNTLAALNITGLNITYINEVVNELMVTVNELEQIIANISFNNITMLINRLNTLNSTVTQLQIDFINYEVYVNASLASLVAADVVFASQISLLQGNVTFILTQISGIQTNVSVLQSDVLALWANLTALWVNQQAQDVLIAAIQLNVTGLQVTMVQLQSTVSGVQTNVTALQVSDAAQQVQIDALQVCCNATNASIVQQAAQLAALNQSLLETQGVDAAQNISIASNTAVNQAQNDTLALLLQNASDAAACCAANNASIIVLQSSISDVNSSVQTLGAAIVLIQGVDADQNQTLASLTAVNLAQNLSITTLQLNATSAAQCCSDNSVSISLIQGVDAEQNATISLLLVNASSASACCIATSNAIALIQGVDTVQNASINALLNNASDAAACCATNTAAIASTNNALSILSADYYAFKSNQTLVDLSVQTQIANLQLQITNNFLTQQACCNSTSANIAALQSAVTTLQGDVVTLTNINTAQNTSITSIQGVDTAQNASIAALQVNSSSAAACCTANSNAITLIQGVDTAQNSSIATLLINATSAAACCVANSNAITLVQGVNTAQNNSITALQSSVSILQGNATSNAACCAANTAALSSINSTAISANNTANAAQTCCTTNSNSITTIQGVDAAQNASIAALQAATIGIGFNVNYNTTPGLSISNSIVLPSASQTVVFNDLTCTGCYNPNSWYNAATGIATVPSTGYYSFNVQVTVAFFNAGNSFFTTLITNSNQVLGTSFWNTVTNNAQIASANINCVKLLTAGTTLRVGIGAYRANGNSPTLSGGSGSSAQALSTQWTMMRLSA